MSLTEGIPIRQHILERNAGKIIEALNNGEKIFKNGDILQHYKAVICFIGSDRMITSREVEEYRCKHHVKMSTHSAVTRARKTKLMSAFSFKGTENRIINKTSNKPRPIMTSDIPIELSLIFNESLKNVLDFIDGAPWNNVFSYKSKNILKEIYPQRVFFDGITEQNIPIFQEHMGTYDMNVDREFILKIFGDLGQSTVPEIPKIVKPKDLSPPPLPKRKVTLPNAEDQKTNHSERTIKLDVSPFKIDINLNINLNLKLARPVMKLLRELVN